MAGQADGDMLQRAQRADVSMTIGIDLYTPVANLLRVPVEIAAI